MQTSVVDSLLEDDANDVKPSFLERIGIRLLDRFQSRETGHQVKHALAYQDEELNTEVQRITLSAMLRIWLISILFIFPQGSQPSFLLEGAVFFSPYSRL